MSPSPVYELGSRPVLQLIPWLPCHTPMRRYDFA